MGSLTTEVPCTGGQGGLRTVKFHVQDPCLVRSHARESMARMSLYSKVSCPRRAKTGAGEGSLCSEVHCIMDNGQMWSLVDRMTD